MSSFDLEKVRFECEYLLWKAKTHGYTVDDMARELSRLQQIISAHPICREESEKLLKRFRENL